MMQQQQQQQQQLPSDHFTLLLQQSDMGMHSGGASANSILSQPAQETSRITSVTGLVAAAPTSASTTNYTLHPSLTPTKLNSQPRSAPQQRLDGAQSDASNRINVSQAMQEHSRASSVATESSPFLARAFSSPSSLPTASRTFHFASDSKPFDGQFPVMSSRTLDNAFGNQQMRHVPSSPIAYGYSAQANEDERLRSQRTEASSGYDHRMSLSNTQHHSDPGGSTAILTDQTSSPPDVRGRYGVDMHVNAGNLVHSSDGSPELSTPWTTPSRRGAVSIERFPSLAEGADPSRRTSSRAEYENNGSSQSDAQRHEQSHDGAIGIGSTLNPPSLSYSVRSSMTTVPRTQHDLNGSSDSGLANGNSLNGTEIKQELYQVNNPAAAFASLQDGKNGSKPPYPYSTIIRLALLAAPNKRMTLADLYEAMENKFEWFKTAGSGWKNSVRHNLSLNRAFVKVARTITEPGKGSWWTVDEEAEPGSTRIRKRKPKQPKAENGEGGGKPYVSSSKTHLHGRPSKSSKGSNGNGTSLGKSRSRLLNPSNDSPVVGSNTGYASMTSALGTSPPSRNRYSPYAPRSNQYTGHPQEVSVPYSAYANSQRPGSTGPSGQLSSGGIYSSLGGSSSASVPYQINDNSNAAQNGGQWSTTNALANAPAYSPSNGVSLANGSPWQGMGMQSGGPGPVRTQSGIGPPAHLSTHNPGSGNPNTNASSQMLPSNCHRSTSGSFVTGYSNYFGGGGGGSGPKPSPAQFQAGMSVNQGNPNASLTRFPPQPPAQTGSYFAHAQPGPGASGSDGSNGSSAFGSSPLSSFSYQNASPRSMGQYFPSGVGAMGHLPSQTQNQNQTHTHTHTQTDGNAFAVSAVTSRPATAPTPERQNGGGAPSTNSLDHWHASANSGAPPGGGGTGGPNNQYVDVSMAPPQSGTMALDGHTSGSGHDGAQSGEPNGR